MTSERFLALVAAYGADARRWPEAERAAARAFAAWKVGRKGLEDGLVLFIFADDRKIRDPVAMDDGPVPQGHFLSDPGNMIRRRMDDDAFFNCRSGSDFDSAVIPPQYRAVPDITVFGNHDISNYSRQFADICAAGNYRGSAVKFIPHGHSFLFFFKINLFS